MQDRVLMMLGLAARAGKIRSGGFETEDAVHRGKAKLLILATDAKKNTVKSITDSGSFRKIPVMTYGTKESIGHAIGKEERSCLAVTDERFADKIVELLESDGKAGRQ